MAGLALVAGGAGGDADAPAAQVVDDVLAGPARQRHRQNVGGRAVGDALAVGNGGQLLRGVDLDVRHMGQLVREVFRPQLHGLGKARDLGRGLRAGAQGGFLAAAGQQGAGVPDPRPDIQRAHALGAADLVAGDGDEVGPQGLGGEGHLQKALDGVGVQQRLGVFRRQAPGDAGDGVDVSQFVVHHHDGYQGRVRPDGGEHLLRRDAAPSVGGEIRHLIALLFHPAAGFQDGAVLHGGGDDVAAQVAVVPAGRLDGPVVPLRAAGGEKQPPGVAAQGLRHGFPPGLHLLFHVQPQRVLGAGVAEAFRQNGVHGVRHLPGHRRGGGVVQIDHRRNSLH